MSPMFHHRGDLCEDTTKQMRVGDGRATRNTTGQKLDTSETGNDSKYNEPRDRENMMGARTARDEMVNMHARESMNDINRHDKIGIRHSYDYQKALVDSGATINLFKSQHSNLVSDCKKVKRV